MSYREIVSREIDAYVNAGYPTETPMELITAGLISYWENPHSAKEMLQVAAEVYPLAIANKLVHDVVSSWKQKSGYPWEDSGANGCFLMALALTANGALADKVLFEKINEDFSSSYIENSVRYEPHRSIQDYEAKVVLLRQLIDQGKLVSLEGYYAAADFKSICQLVVPDFGQINAELIAYFAVHPEHLHELHWRKFEELLDAVFKNQGYHTELGPGSGDGGVDIRLVQKDSIGEILTLVQAKRYREDNPINLQAIQALHGVVDDQRAHRGLFVTTSRYLPGAQDFAQRQNGRLVLADLKNVAAWCKSITRL